MPRPARALDAAARSPRKACGSAPGRGRACPDARRSVIVHGLGDTLESYVDRADALRRRGHTVLLLDLRAHGGSEGRYTTLGGREREDVRAAMERCAPRAGRRGLVLMGHSMGAVAVAARGGRPPDVRAVIVEAPYDTYRANVAHHAWLLYRLPRWVPHHPDHDRRSRSGAAGFDADDVDAVAAAARLAAPLLAIADGADPRMPEAVVRRVADAHAGPAARSGWLPGAEHVGAVAAPRLLAGGALVPRRRRRLTAGAARAPARRARPRSRTAARCPPARACSRSSTRCTSGRTHRAPWPAAPWPPRSRPAPAGS